MESSTFFMYGQSLTSVLNDPKATVPSDWYAADMLVEPRADVRSVSLSDLSAYLDQLSAEYDTFLANGSSSNRRTASAPTSGRAGAQSEPVRVSWAPRSTRRPPISIPQVYFDESFDLAKPATFEAAFEQLFDHHHQQHHQQPSAAAAAQHHHPPTHVSGRHRPRRSTASAAAVFIACMPCCFCCMVVVCRC
eukprot:TRINITY_DN3870_c0_g3_i1.p1 TRINITY_DN3870_c0_g3~~TRINITY_DN3870_c0_g3_i1.p1  ORF type:complete len:192 (-),score=69.47 TRINITY_DN3870_c0_g3_i1:377-952(-)